MCKGRVRLCATSASTTDAKAGLIGRRSGEIAMHEKVALRRGLRLSSRRSRPRQPIIEDAVTREKSQTAKAVQITIAQRVTVRFKGLRVAERVASVSG